MHAYLRVCVCVRACVRVWQVWGEGEHMSRILTCILKIKYPVQVTSGNKICTKKLFYIIRIIYLPDRSKRVKKYAKLQSRNV